MMPLKLGDKTVKKRAITLLLESGYIVIGENEVLGFLVIPTVKKRFYNTKTHKQMDKLKVGSNK